MALEKEMETYRKNLPEWGEYEGKFVLIHGEEVIDFFGAYEDAIKAGYQRFALKPFLVRRISLVEQVQRVTRLAVPSSAAAE